MIALTLIGSYNLELTLEPDAKYHRLPRAGSIEDQ
jgi:hypothetical protein